MAQTRIIVADANHAIVRANQNAVNESLATLNSGSTPPQGPVEDMVWLDTSGAKDTLKVYKSGSWTTSELGNKGEKGNTGDRGPQGIGGEEALHALEVLEDKCLDLSPGPVSSGGWGDATDDTQGGMALRSGAPFSLALAKAASYSRTPSSPGGRYLAVRIPADVEPGQARVILRRGSLSYTLQLTSFHLLGSDTSWKWYGENLELGLAVTSITLQRTGIITHLGQSTFSGKLTQGNVYAQVKEIIQTDNRAVITLDDADSEIQFRFLATDKASVVRTFDTNVPAGATDTDFNIVQVIMSGDEGNTRPFYADGTSLVLKDIQTSDSNAALREVSTSRNAKVFSIWKTEYTQGGTRFFRLNIRRRSPNNEEWQFRLFTAFCPPDP